MLTWATGINLSWCWSIFRLNKRHPFFVLFFLHHHSNKVCFRLCCCFVSTITRLYNITVCFNSETNASLWEMIKLEGETNGSDQRICLFLKGQLIKIHKGHVVRETDDEEMIHIAKGEREQCTPQYTHRFLMQNVLRKGLTNPQMVYKVTVICQLFGQLSYIDRKEAKEVATVVDLYTQVLLLVCGRCVTNCFL